MTGDGERLTLSDPAVYRICVQGIIESSWSETFDGFTISHEFLDGPHPRSYLQGRVLDQAQLFGVLNRLYGLGLPLILAQVIW